MAYAHVSVKSNGNFFISLADPLMLMSWGWDDKIAREATEYSPDGDVVRKWDVGISDPDSFVVKVFVDVDDSLLVEILALDHIAFRGFRDGAVGAGGRVKDHYLAKLYLAGKVSRYDLPLGEYLLGWMGESREIVTQSADRKELKIRKLPI